MASDGKVTTQVLDGRTIAGQIRSEVAEEIASLKQQYANFAPLLVIVQVRELIERGADHEVDPHM